MKRKPAQPNPGFNFGRALLATLAGVLASGTSVVPTNTAPVPTAGVPAVSAAAQTQTTDQARTTPPPVSSRTVQAPIALGNTLTGPTRGPGRTPYEWGTSRACEQMHRKNARKGWVRT